jgi:excisionase family DNA binding protein
MALDQASRGRIGGSNKLISMREAAELLNVSYKRLAANRETWGIKSVRVGGRIKFAERELQAYVERNTEG